MVLLIDTEGSMVPFHRLSRQLVETARRGGRLRQTRVYYFHDYPDKYLYRHPALLKAQPISEVFEEIGERAVVLTIGDGGAARGYFDEERVDYTEDFIQQLQQSVRYFAWLNPMPSDDWQDNTAGEIASFVLPTPYSLLPNREVLGQPWGKARGDRRNRVSGRELAGTRRLSHTDMKKFCLFN